MKLTSMQFDGDGGYDTPMNAGATAAKSVEGDRGDYSPINAMGSTPAKSATKAKAPKAIDKSAWDRGTKVSQSTVDAVKDAGRGNMGKVPQDKVKNGAPGYDGSTFSPNAPVSSEYKEATKRVYPNGAPAAKAEAKPKVYGGAAADKYKAEKNKAENPFSKSTGGGMPKVAAPKSSKETVMKARNAEIEEANKQGKWNDKFAYTIINGLKSGKEAYGAGTQERSQIPGTQTKTQKAQAEYKATTAANKAAAESKPAGKIKVSQATVDAVKAQGKAKATANSNSNVSNAEYKEAVKRIYPTSKKK